MLAKRTAVLTAATLSCALVLAPAAAFADDAAAADAAAVVLAPVVEDAQNDSATISAQVVAVATQTVVSFPQVGATTLYYLGGGGTISATVSTTGADGIRGTVEFFDGAVSLGSAPLAVDAPATSGTVSIPAQGWPASGARQVTAVFTPAEGTDLAASTSAAQTYRVVDPARVVADVALTGAPTATIAGAELDWTIANIWFSNFSVGFEREVISGPVTLPDLQQGTTIPERQAYFFRPFTFAQGTGAKDAAGNRVLSFTGTARLTSGTGNEWNFADPQVHIGANGDGYITAAFSGFYDIGGYQAYPETRVAIATFTGASVVADGSGVVDVDIVLNWDGQAGAVGTWAQGYDSSFPNEFVSLLNPLVNLFFAKSSVATDASKIPHPISLRFTETTVMPPVVPGVDDPDTGATPAVPGTDDSSDDVTAAAPVVKKIPATGSVVQGQGAIAVAAAIVLGGIALLTQGSVRRRRRG